MDCDVRLVARARFRSPPSLTPSLPPPPPPPRPSQAWVRASVGKLNLGRVSIDDVANRDPRDTTPPALTSPRSVRACLEHGVDPAMLAPKRVSDFAEPGLSAEHQRFKWERHERVRRERVDALNAARLAMPAVEDAASVPGVVGATRLAGSVSSPAPASPSRTHPRSSLGGGPLLRSPAAANSNASRPATARGRIESHHPALAPISGRESVSAVREEERRLEAARRRTARQLEVMQEAKRTAERRRAKNEAKVAQARRVDAARDAEKAQVDKKHRDAVFERIQRQKEEAKALEKAKRRDALERFEANAELRRAIKRREEEERRVRNAAEVEKQRKLDEFRRRTDAIFAAQQAQVREKERRMRAKEAARAAAKDEEAAENARHAKARRAHQRERLGSARANAERRLESRRDELLERAARAEHRRMTLAERNEARAREKRAAVAAAEERRKARYSEVRESARSRADALLAKSEADDRALAELQERRKREAAMVSLERKLGVEERREKVECMRRFKEYQSARLLEKIESDTERARRLTAAKEELRRARRENNAALSMEREAILRADEREIRRSAARPATAGGRFGPGLEASPLTPADFSGFHTPTR